MSKQSWAPPPVCSRAIARVLAKDADVLLPG